ncbi:MAG: sulfatase [Holophagales bacterium]|nr:sulfatase [Holophagales bacterium]
MPRLFPYPSAGPRASEAAAAAASSLEPKRLASGGGRARRRSPGAWLAAAFFLLLAAWPDPGLASRRFPNILLISIDTLRYDRVSAHGYARPTTPHIDSLMRGGVRFDQARTPEPLTAPAMASVFTALHPHDHGASRNGLAMRPDLPSWTKILADRGYRTSAIVGNWTLRSELSGLEEHFGHYEAVLNRKRWGLFLGEATADDLNKAALRWLAGHLEREGDWPFLLWVHYVEPHAPYRFHKEVAARLGVSRRGSKSDHYDTEVAFVDRAVGDLLSEVYMRVPREDLLVIFLADHGESLGEHGYWGHGRNVYDPSLRIPMAFAWQDRIEPLPAIQDPASSIDIAATVFGLLGLEVPMSFAGQDWSGALTGETPVAGMPVAGTPVAGTPGAGTPGAGAPDVEPRITFHQAHKGAVQRRNNSNARRQGLLEIAIVTSGPEGLRKETLRVKDRHRRKLFDLGRDRAEMGSSVDTASPASDALAQWLSEVRIGLEAADDLPPPSLDDESIEQLRALGYID